MLSATWNLAAQQPGNQRNNTAITPSDTSIEKTTGKEKRLLLSGMMILRYAFSPNEMVDINGRHHTESSGYTTSSFALRRARLQAKTIVSSKVEAALLLNLTDFTGDPRHKVLELATVKYHFNPHLNLQVGQFRPYFGREDLYPEEQLQSLEWSNGYYAFGGNGWQSFQMGATLYGEVPVFNQPVRYYIGIFNGNGRNQLMDNDKGKLFPVRIETTLKGSTSLAVNAGLGKEQQASVWAWSADLCHRVPLNGKATLQLQAEYRKGTNPARFYSDTTGEKTLEDYTLSGFYVLPALSCRIEKKGMETAGCTLRWELLNTPCKGENNRQHTLTPLAYLQLSAPCRLRLEAGAILNHFDENVPNTTSYSHTRYIMQVKASF